MELCVQMKLCLSDTARFASDPIFRQSVEQMVRDAGKDMPIEAMVQVCNPQGAVIWEEKTQPSDESAE